MHDNQSPFCRVLSCLAGVITPKCLRHTRTSHRRTEAIRSYSKYASAVVPQHLTFLQMNIMNAPTYSPAAYPHYGTTAPPYYQGTGQGQYYQYTVTPHYETPRVQRERRARRERSRGRAADQFRQGHRRTRYNQSSTLYQQARRESPERNFRPTTPPTIQPLPRPSRYSARRSSEISPMHEDLRYNPRRQLPYVEWDIQYPPSDARKYNSGHSGSIDWTAMATVDHTSRLTIVQTEDAGMQWSTRWGPIVVRPRESGLRIRVKDVILAIYAHFQQPLDATYITRMGPVSQRAVEQYRRQRQERIPGSPSGYLLIDVLRGHTRFEGLKKTSRGPQNEYVLLLSQGRAF